LKKILLISDTHGLIDDKIIKHAKDANEIWHAGDIGDITVTNTLKKINPIRAVYGNIDNHIVRSEFSLDCKFICNGLNIWITHIGGYPGKYVKRIKDVLEYEKIDILIFGHSHILKIIYDKKYDLLHINPGAVGKVGFHKKRTMVKFEINNRKIENLEIIEFNR
tara:strand:+ start:247 stop:738 length:492 start_codon:yes stop_codon:yes gene_type:complete